MWQLKPLSYWLQAKFSKAQCPKALESKVYKPLKVLYKPNKPCYHYGSKFYSIYLCEEYHALYYDYFHPKSNIPYSKPVKSESSSDFDKGKSKSFKFNSKTISKKGSNLCSQWILIRGY